VRDDALHPGTFHSVVYERILVENLDRNQQFLRHRIDKPLQLPVIVHEHKAKRVIELLDVGAQRKVFDIRSSALGVASNLHRDARCDIAIG
jgi:hypothetical protein